MCMWSALGESTILRFFEPRVPIPDFVTGCLPRCEGQRVWGWGGVQMWPQGGVESPASQQYFPGWAQLFLETDRRGWGPQTSWGLLAQAGTHCPYEMGAFRSSLKLLGPLPKMGGCILPPKQGLQTSFIEGTWSTQQCDSLHHIIAITAVISALLCQRQSSLTAQT